MNLESIIIKAQKNISKLSLTSKTVLFSLGMLGLSTIGFSQSKTSFSSERNAFLALDSLSRIHQIDSLNSVAWKLSLSSPAIALNQLNKNIRNSESIGYFKGEADALVRSGSIHYNRGNYALALKDHLSSLKLYQKLNSSNKDSSLNFSLFVADAYTNAGVAYDGLGRLDSTFKFYQLASKIYSKSNDFSGIFMINNNLAKLLQEKGDYTRANKYYRNNYFLVLDKLKSDSLNKTLLRNYALTLNNLATIFEFNNNLDSATVYYSKSIEISDKIDDVLIKSSYLGSLARVKLKQGNFNSALSILHSTIDLDVSLNNDEGLVLCLQELSDAYRGLGDLDNSFLYLDSSLTLAKKLDSPSLLLNFYGKISSSFESAGKLSKNSSKNSAIYFEKALEFEKKQERLKDSLFSQENTFQLNSLEVQYRTKLREQENALLKKEDSLQEAQLTNQRWKYYGALGGIGLLLFSSIFIVGAYRKQKKMSKKLFIANSNLENAVTQTNLANDLLIKQKKHIEEIHHEISESINYATHLQQAILPEEKLLDKYLSDHFVLFKPKDKVSGDFYWWTHIENHTIITAADSTGHGVPGAFMSVLGSSFLREIVQKEYITHTGVILRKLRKEIIRSLKQKGEMGEQKDGMDMAIISINHKTNTVQFSGANNPLYILTNDNRDLQGFENLEGVENFYEIKPDKMPIAIYEKMDKFTVHEIQLEKGDQLFMFSDGYADQFGGPKGKKFKYKPFKQILSENRDKPMKDQKEILNKAFEDWKGNLEQVDDVVVLGIRI